MPRVLSGDRRDPEAKKTVTSREQRVYQTLHCLIQWLMAELGTESCQQLLDMLGPYADE